MASKINYDSSDVINGLNGIGAVPETDGYDITVYNGEIQKIISTFGKVNSAVASLVTNTNELIYGSGETAAPIPSLSTLETYLFNGSTSYDAWKSGMSEERTDFLAKLYNEINTALNDRMLMMDHGYTNELIVGTGSPDIVKGSGVTIKSSGDLSSLTTSIPTENVIKTYADGKMSKLSAAANNKIILGGTTAATAKSSGKEIGGSALASTPTANTVATELGVKTYADTKMSALSTAAPDKLLVGGSTTTAVKSSGMSVRSSGEMGRNASTIPTEALIADYVDNHSSSGDDSNALRDVIALNITISKTGERVIISNATVISKYRSASDYTVRAMSSDWELGESDVSIGDEMSALYLDDSTDTFKVVAITDNRNKIYLLLIDAVTVDIADVEAHYGNCASSGEITSGGEYSELIEIKMLDNCASSYNTRLTGTTKAYDIESSGMLTVSDIAGVVNITFKNQGRQYDLNLSALEGFISEGSVNAFTNKNYFNDSTYFSGATVFDGNSEETTFLNKISITSGDGIRVAGLYHDVSLSRDQLALALDRGLSGEFPKSDGADIDLDDIPDGGLALDGVATNAPSNVGGVVYQYSNNTGDQEKEERYQIYIDNDAKVFTRNRYFDHDELELIWTNWKTGSGNGDVTSSGNNTFTGANTFTEDTIFAANVGFDDLIDINQGAQVDTGKDIKFMSGSNYKSINYNKLVSLENHLTSKASPSALGHVKVDNDTIKVNTDGTIYATNSGGGSSGDVTSDGDNLFTGENTFDGYVWFNKPLNLYTATCSSRETDHSKQVSISGISTIREGDIIAIKFENRLKVIDGEAIEIRINGLDSMTFETTINGVDPISSYTYTANTTIMENGDIGLFQCIDIGYTKLKLLNSGIIDFSERSNNALMADEVHDGAYLSSDNTFTGENAFNGNTIFSAGVGFDGIMDVNDSLQFNINNNTYPELRFDSNDVQISAIKSYSAANLRNILEFISAGNISRYASGNSVNNDGHASVVCGGENNTITGADNAICGGENNSMTSGQSAIVGGMYNEITGYNSSTAAGCYNAIIAGTYNKLNASKNSVALGGQYNNHTSSDLITVGGGTDTARANLFKIDNTGKTYGNGAWNSSGADYAEYFEWLDSNPNSDDRVGLFVTLDGENIRFATSSDDYILGVVSGAPTVVGDAPEDVWHSIWLRDMYGRIQYHTVHYEAEYREVEETDPETGETTKKNILVREAHDEVEPIVNPDYDPSKEYVPRSKRPEWATVGMMGKLIVIDDGTCEVNGYATVSDKGDGTATAATSDSLVKYRVLARLDETHVKVLFR